MPVKAKKTTKAKKTKKVKKPAVRAAAKKAKERTGKKIAKKAFAKTSPAKKAVKQRKQGKSKPAKQSVKKAPRKRTTTTPTEKSAWRISPEISQSVVDIDIWKKGDLRIEHTQVYRSGWLIVDQLPDLSGYNPDEGVNILEEFEFDKHELIDGSEGTSIFPNELPQEERERLMALSDAELVDEGWTIESATRFSGPLVVEEV
jgi:hypothetical protein